MPVSMSTLPARHVNAQGSGHNSSTYLGTIAIACPKTGDVDRLWRDYSPCYREDKYYRTEPYPTVTVSAVTKFEASEDVESVLAILNRFGRG